MSNEVQNVKLARNANTPPNIIAYAARFNKQFLDSQLGGNPTTVGIGKMLTVMSEQDNTMRALSRILGRDYNEFVYKGSHIYNPKILDKPYS